MDDFLYGGNEHFLKTVLPKIRATFEIGLEESDNLKYLGLDIKQSPGSISLSLDKYATCLTEIDQSDLGIDRKRLLTPKESSCYKHIVGQINWVSTQARPDISFDNCILGNAGSWPSVADIHHANKVIRKNTWTACFSDIPWLSRPEDKSHCVLQWRQFCQPTWQRLTGRIHCVHHRWQRTIFPANMAKQASSASGQLYSIRRMPGSRGGCRNLHIAETQAWRTPLPPTQNDQDILTHRLQVPTWCCAHMYFRWKQASSNRHQYAQGDGWTQRNQRIPMGPHWIPGSQVPYQTRGICWLPPWHIKMLFEVQAQHWYLWVDFCCCFCMYYVCIYICSVKLYL